MKKEFWFLFLAQVICFYSNLLAQPMAVHTLDNYFCQFSIPADFKIFQNTENAFVAKNDVMGIFIYPRMDSISTPQQMQERVKSLAESNKLENLGEVMLLDGEKINGLFGYAIEGTQNDTLCDVLILQNWNHQDRNIYVALFYPESLSDLAIIIMTSFKPTDVPITENVDKDGFNYKGLAELSLSDEDYEEENDYPELVIQSVDFSVFPEAKILNIDGIYVNYEIRDDPEAFLAINRAFDSNGVYVDFAMESVKENNWVKDLKGEEQWNVDKDHCLYKLVYYKIAEFGNKTLLMAPSYENKDVCMPQFNINDDIYLVIETKDVKILKSLD